MSRSFHHLGSALAGLALSMLALTAATGPAEATRGTPVPPNPCLHVVGTPDPCPAPTPEPPEPVDPDCLRVNVQPLQCPYQP